MKNKPLSERETRIRMINLAKQLGCDGDLRKIFERYDPLLKCSTDELERKQISIMANAELHRLFNFRNALVVDGQEIIPQDKDWQQPE